MFFHVFSVSFSQKFSIFVHALTRLSWENHSLNFILALARPIFWFFFSHGHNRPDFFLNSLTILLYFFSTDFLVVFRWFNLSRGGGYRIFAQLFSTKFSDHLHTRIWSGQSWIYAPSGISGAKFLSRASISHSSNRASKSSRFTGRAGIRNNSRSSSWLT